MVMNVEAQKFCPGCWTPVGDGATRCPVCDSDILLSGTSDHYPESAERASEFIDTTADDGDESTAETAGKRSSFLLIAALILLILSGVGVTVLKDFLTPQYSAADFLGEWLTVDSKEIEDLTTRVDSGKEIKIRIWEEKGDVTTDIPMPGEIEFENKLENNHLKGVFTAAFSEDETSPVVAELSRDRSRMTIYFRLNDMATRPDTILHLKRP